MVQCMEAWFLADHSALTDCFGVGFKASKLPPLVNGSLEAIPRNKIEKGLNAATKATKKQRYEKTRDGFDLLARVNPMKVCKASFFARRLRDTLDAILPNQ